MTRTGLQHFDDGGFALGTVTGVRWWTLDEKPRPRSQLQVAGREPPGELELHGQYGPWKPGENTAECKASRYNYDSGKYEQRGHPAPNEDCSCGYWAYWTWESSPLGEAKRLVVGVVEGYGEGTLIGTKGFRAAKAKIVALVCRFEILVSDGYCGDPDCGQPHFVPTNMFHRGPQGMDTYSALTGSFGRHEHVKQDLAAKAEIEIRLSEQYGVPVYANVGYMLQQHPPTRDYLPQPEKVNVERVIEELQAGLAQGKVSYDHAMSVLAKLERLNLITRRVVLPKLPLMPPSV